MQFILQKANYLAGQFHQLHSERVSSLRMGEQERQRGNSPFICHVTGLDTSWRGLIRNKVNTCIWRLARREAAAFWGKRGTAASSSRRRRELARLAARVSQRAAHQVRIACPTARVRQ